MASWEDEPALRDALDRLGFTVDDIYREYGSEIESQLNSRADDVENFWVSISPVDTREYVKSFEREAFTDSKRRPVRRVINKARHAHILEYGSKHTDPQAIRAKVADQFGCEGRYMDDE